MCVLKWVRGITLSACVYGGGAGKIAVVGCILSIDAVGEIVTL